MKLKSIRQGKGMTQKALAKKAKMSMTYLCNVENDKRMNPSLNTLRRLAKALQVRVRDLVADE